MSYLFFDTETTDLPNPNLPYDHPKQAHICQLACLLTDDKFNELNSFCVLIKPRDWNIQAGAEAAHGISQERCETFGVHILSALGLFHNLMKLSKSQIAYNADFDKQLINIDTGCSSMPIVTWQNLKCPMKPLTPICKIPNKWKNGFKWPKLQEAYEFCFKKKFDKAHDAMADVKALCQVYQWCLNNGVTI